MCLNFIPRDQFFVDIAFNNFAVNSECFIFIIYITFLKKGLWELQNHVRSGEMEQREL